eukprot:609118-Pleurochrysis_carterae.AAC.2
MGACSNVVQMGTTRPSSLRPHALPSVCRDYITALTRPTVDRHPCGIETTFWVTLPDTPSHHRRELEQANEIVRRTANLLKTAHAAGAEPFLNILRIAVQCHHRYSSMSATCAALDHAGRPRLKSRYFRVVDYVSAVRSRRSLTEIHYAAHKPRTVAITADLGKSSLPTPHPREHGRKLENRRRVVLAATTLR